MVGPACGRPVSKQARGARGVVGTELLRVVGEPRRAVTVGRI